MDQNKVCGVDRLAANRMRFVPGSREGHYESWFQRANHPSRRLAFWIRYTIFSPKERPDAAVGELWTIFFDGENDRIVAAKEEFPLAACRFGTGALDVRIGDATLDESSLAGAASTRSHRFEWRLRYESSEPPLLLLPVALYERAVPKAKALVGSPNAVFRGTIVVDGETVEIDAWSGSQNHNWGSRHTDSYAWGQVAGFDDAPDVFLECSTAQIRLGPLWTPRMSLVVLRVRGEEYRWNSLREAVCANGRFDFTDWRIDSSSSRGRVMIHVTAPRSAFVALTYPNPPGGSKTCLNTKLATCELAFERHGRATQRFRTSHRAAFEILTDRADHGIPVVV